MQRITSGTSAPLFEIAASRRIEQAAAAALPPHTLMQRAGLAVARLAMATVPHARTIWIACGPGNNGGDGFEAATQLQHRGFAPVVTRIGNDERLPADAAASLQRARDAGVRFADAPPASADLVIDALLGLGAARPPEGPMADWLRRMHTGSAPVLSVDTPSGLNADTGVLALDFLAPAVVRGPGVRRLCLSLLTLKPGLFTSQGRDAVGELWFDDLDVMPGAERPTARLPGEPSAVLRPHTSHKGTYGDVAVIGGAPGMVGAALLAATAALHAGAGRVYVASLDTAFSPIDTAQPELMFRTPDALDLRAMTVVCGCGAGTAVRDPLPRVLQEAHALVLDADALNAIAADGALQTLLVARARSGHRTVLTPHPLEAARLLGTGAAEVQGDRLRAAQLLSERFGATIVLKGSGTIVAAAGEVPTINPTGNARLASAGTGDVLAGMIGAALAAGQPSVAASREAVWRHGDLADHWPTDVPLTAGTLARGWKKAS
ncbi:Nicotinamide nucleotide repair protein [Variovorax sp. PBS-H4]|uniref:NAD(P)H-hydrate dehydratase n=1 Tax=Variovorax sp. PBS-H4 TaxID=434008 RepID=UPI00131688F9|nr:NAD(P)H-hydrate dehydratase [Variovorax sp. PBS-H4]VTU35247.1 Nicotinamide nucleotide repair protein [Variovorax sp. PBS-H4]